MYHLLNAHFSTEVVSNIIVLHFRFCLIPSENMEAQKRGTGLGALTGLAFRPSWNCAGRSHRWAVCVTILAEMPLSQC